jgi:hypothetical protein
MIGDFHEVLNFNRLFLKRNRFIWNYWSGRYSPFIDLEERGRERKIIIVYKCTSHSPNKETVKQ